MTPSSSKHGFVALIALSIWVAAIITAILNRANLFWALPQILLGSVATTVGTVLLSRYWIRRGRHPSYGTLLAVPLLCACLLRVGPMFWYACRYGAWYYFTPGFWQQTKGGWSALYYPLAVIGGICILPAAAVVVYHQGRQKIDVRNAA